MKRFAAVATLATVLAGVGWSASASAAPAQFRSCPDGYALTASGPGSQLGAFDANRDGFVCVSTTGGTPVDDNTLAPVTLPQVVWERLP
jgi:hypothetical protein